MRFDTVETRHLKDSSVEYGVIYGNQTIVFIKTEAGGSCDKYLQMAKTLHGTVGATVVCASNPTPDSFEMRDAEFLRETVAEKEGETTLYFIGVLDGALQGLLTATRHFDFKRLLLINTPLVCHLQRVKAAILRVAADACFVYGKTEASQSDLPHLRDAIRFLQYATAEITPPKTVTLDFLSDAEADLSEKLFGRILEA